MKGKVREPARETPVIADLDVLVVGGGPSGVPAAAAAARMGASVMLIESYGFLGGMWTAGLVLTLAGYNCWLTPYERCVDGIAGEWLRRATAKGFAEDNRGWVLNCDPDGMKLIADEIVLESGVDVLFHTRAVAPLLEAGKVAGCFIENLDGRGVVRAKTVIDCTGNGDMLYRAGAECLKSEHMQPLTLGFEIGNVSADPDISHTEPRCLPIGPEPVTLTGQLLKKNASRRLDIQFDYDRLNEEQKKGRLPLFGGPWIGGLWKDVIWMNTVRVVADGSDARDKSRAEILGRKNAYELAEYFYAHIPGMEKGRIQRLAAEIGVRETRRLRGVYTLTEEDVKDSKRFDDSIGLGCWAIDIHPREAHANHSLYAPRPFHIPYRILLPEKIDGLLTAGRCVSADRSALASIRVGATCGVTGQAAGAAAAIASRKGIQPRNVDIRELQSELQAQHVMLDI